MAYSVAFSVSSFQPVESPERRRGEKEGYARRARMEGISRNKLMAEQGRPKGTTHTHTYAHARTKKNKTPPQKTLHHWKIITWWI